MRERKMKRNSTHSLPYVWVSEWVRACLYQQQQQTFDEFYCHNKTKEKEVCERLYRLLRFAYTMGYRKLDTETYIHMQKQSQSQKHECVTFNTPMRVI